jgi:hypothetical protein
MRQDQFSGRSRSQRQYVTGQTMIWRGAIVVVTATVLTMQTKTREVLDAAESWLSAVHAVTAADEAGRRSDPEQAALDTAEVELATAIMDWRNAGRPD